MKCRMCGYEFDENEIPNRGCSGCGKHGCHSVHCPNCGFGNSPELDQEFDFIIKLKDKILSPVSPISNIPLLALNKESKTFGTIKNNNVPAPKIAAMTKPDTFKI